MTKFWENQMLKRQRVLINTGEENVEDKLTESMDYYEFLREFFGEMSEPRKRVVRKVNISS